MSHVTKVKLKDTNMNKNLTGLLVSSARNFLHTHYAISLDQTKLPTRLIC